MKDHRQETGLLGGQGIGGVDENDPTAQLTV